MDSPKTPERSELRRSPSRPYQRRQREAPPQDLPAEPASLEAAEAEPAVAKAPARARRRTAARGPEATSPVEATLAAPAPVPASAPRAVAPPVRVETWLPGPRELPTAPASTPAPAPGLAPRGDSRSLRNGERFALVYRVLCSVITRTGQVGELGAFRCVDYPTPAAASNAYARCCSSWVSEGFSDYRG